MRIFEGRAGNSEKQTKRGNRRENVAGQFGLREAEKEDWEDCPARNEEAGGIAPGIFTPERTRIVDELVIEPAVVLVINRAVLWDFLQAHPPVMLRLLEGFARQTRESIEIMAGIALRRVRERVIFRLLERADSHGTSVNTAKTVEISMSQSTLAGMVGASRENVSRAISVLAGEGHVHYRAGVFTIDAAALRRVAPAVAPGLPRRNQRLRDIDRS